MTIRFIGHGHLSSHEKIKNEVKAQIRMLLERQINVVCYLGGYGDFDAICAQACKELKEEGADLLRLYVSPYRSSAEGEKIKLLQKSGLCDASLYPPIESTPNKYAISKRNEWMMSNADVVVACVHREFGGAYRALLVARRKNKKVINVFDDLEK